MTRIDHPSCAVCAATDALLPVKPIFDDRYGHPGEFELARCPHCAHIMTVPQLQESDLPHLYGTYYPRKSLTAASVALQAGGVAMPWSKLRRWWAGTDNQGQYGVRPGERMLDIGCGSGLSLLEARALGAQGWGVEADPNVQQIAKQLGVTVHQGSLQDHPFPDVKFDLVVLNQVIEHLPDPGRAMDLIRERLAPNGRVAMVFPNIESLLCKLSGTHWINWHIPYHLHHFTLATFTALAQRHGYAVRNVRTVTPNLWTVLQLHANRLTMERGVPSTLWAQSPDPGTATGNVPKVLLRRRLRRILLALVMVPIALFNRIIDALGMGDSLMVELVPIERQ